MSSLGVVVGNPKVASRTLTVAREVLRSAATAVGVEETEVTCLLYTSDAADE